MLIWFSFTTFGYSFYGKSSPTLLPGSECLIISHGPYASPVQHGCAYTRCGGILEYSLSLIPQLHEAGAKLRLLFSPPCSLCQAQCSVFHRCTMLEWMNEWRCSATFLLLVQNNSFLSFGFHYNGYRQWDFKNLRLERKTELQGGKIYNPKEGKGEAARYGHGVRKRKILGTEASVLNKTPSQDHKMQTQHVNLITPNPFSTALVSKLVSKWWKHFYLISA